jgi:hypothetical protein
MFMTRILHTEIKSGERLVATDITDLTFFPKGAILTFSFTAWSATSTEFKKIWKICDGTDGTPNLVNKFLCGGISSGATGDGRMTLTTEHLPSHTHSGSADSAGEHSHIYSFIAHTGLSPASDLTLDDAYLRWKSSSANTGRDGSHVHTVTIGNTGNGKPFDVIPAFYTVIYIIKVS